MPTDLPTKRIAQMMGTKSVQVVKSIQSLWSGYGEIVRVRVIGQTNDQPDQTVVVKHVCPPSQCDHKYGWSGDTSHNRKLRSYDNELNWYRNASQLCGTDCRVPKLLAADSAKTETEQSNWLIVLEDLDAAGYPRRARSVSDAQLDACLRWLANFHATFLCDTNQSDADSAARRYMKDFGQSEPTGTLRLAPMNWPLCPTDLSNKRQRRLTTV